MVLLALVLGLWGTVIYKYVSQYLSKPETVSSSSSNASIQALVRQKDTFELTPLSRDPFLGKIMISSNKPIKRKSGSKPVQIKEPVQKTVSFPHINYYGYIKNKDQPEMLVLLKVNGKLLKLKSGQVSEGLRVVKIFRDSVQLSFNREKRSFKKG